MGKGYSIKKEQKTIITPVPKGDFDLDKPNRTKYQPPPMDPVYHPDDFYERVPKKREETQSYHCRHWR